MESDEIFRLTVNETFVNNLFEDKFFCILFLFYLILLAIFIAKLQRFILIFLLGRRRFGGDRFFLGHLSLGWFGRFNRFLGFFLRGLIVTMFTQWISASLWILLCIWAGCSWATRSNDGSCRFLLFETPFKCSNDILDIVQVILRLPSGIINGPVFLRKIEKLGTTENFRN